MNDIIIEINRKVIHDVSETKTGDGSAKGKSTATSCPTWREKYVLHR